MTQYNTLNVKLSNLQLNKLKSAITNGTEVTLNLLSNLIGISKDETNFPHKLLLTNTQVSNIGKAFANGSSANVKLLKTQLPKMMQSGGLVHNIIDTLLDPSEMFSKIIKWHLMIKWMQLVILNLLLMPLSTVLAISEQE